MRTIHQADVMAWVAAFEGERFHALLCDPPYHLSSITKRFGGDNAAPAQHGRDGLFSRASKGFMGKQWDGGDIAYDPATWAAFATLLHPGAFGMAFAGSRGLHRQMVAIEDAGLIIHPLCLCWGFGSGFPKATRVKNAPVFDGHRYGGQALKPAFEPIIVFQKPYGKRPLDSIIRTGAGTLWIEGAKVGSDNVRGSGTTIGYSGHSKGNGGNDSYGRWAANLMLSHSAYCIETPAGWACTPDCAVRKLGDHSGELTSGTGAVRRHAKGLFGLGGDGKHNTEFGDTGSAARYFFNADYLLDRLEHEAGVLYHAKASTTEREAGLREFPTHTTPIKEIRDQANPNNAMGAGMRARVERGESAVVPRRNPHPTIKPLSLVKHLATLLLPPIDYAPRRLLVPFAGAGSEVIGAMLAGWEHIEGVEREADYAVIARARLDYWTQHSVNIAGSTKPKAKINKVNANQMVLI